MAVVTCQRVIVTRLITMSKLTIKQEKFCSQYVETGSATEAYRLSYDAARMKAETVHRTAKELLDNPKVAARISELKAYHAERHKITVDDLIAELEEARSLAIKTEAPAPAVSATMGKAKLLGMDKQVIDHTSSDGSMTPTFGSLYGKPQDDSKPKS